MNCPKCNEHLRSVSALTHGCINCQRLWLMINGKLQDGGEWPVAEGQKHILLLFGRGCLLACIISIMFYATLIEVVGFEATWFLLGVLLLFSTFGRYAR